MSNPRITQKELFSLDGKTAICTGATGGLGSELCLSLAEAGAHIISIQIPGDAGGLRLAELIKSTGRKFQSLECDLKSAPSLRSVFNKLWTQGVEPDILLNCAGLNIRGPIQDMQDDDIDLIFAINLKATYVAAQEFGRRLLSLQRPGKIINIASLTSFIGMYNVSAYFKTPLTTNLVQDAEYNDFILKRTPAGRWGEPPDLRGALVFLASAASDFVTGTSIVVDGGMLGK
ncbi:hypothetical protein LTR84_009284 [Exophiala bonariae]|uniref:2-deoxy-D-gluconate 3-dehydrogenase n=1 Tax=Exophiala bonariae TaxID=1690606 RepID=A0AAV9MVB1_9EURO|nr:hypothetical protein LTR84_009284 [Exophiala bonariae]